VTIAAGDLVLLAGAKLAFLGRASLNWFREAGREKQLLSKKAAAGESRHWLVVSTGRSAKEKQFFMAHSSGENPSPPGCLHVIGISARHHVVGLFGVQRLAHAALQLL
jgi:hypothetical protein